MLRKALRIIAINGVLVAAVLVAAEVTFGSWFRPSIPPRSAIVDRTLSYRQNLYEPASVITYTRDRDGLRGVRGPLDAVQLVTLGGSTTDQRFIADGETWQDVITSLTGIQIANAGIDGMSSSGHLIAMQEWLHPIPNLRARFFLHFIGVNDAWLPGQLAPSDQPGTNSWMTRIRLRSAIVRGASQLLDLMHATEEVRHAKIIPHQLDNIEAVKAHVDRDVIQAFVETHYKTNLQRLLDLHRDHGEQAIFVSQPAHPAVLLRRGNDVFTRSYLSPPRWAVALGMMNAATAQVCRSRPETCRFIDVAGKAEFEQADFYDSVHVTPAGACKLGTFLARELIALAATESAFSDLAVRKVSGLTAP